MREDKYIGISDDRIKRMLGVARRSYMLADFEGKDEIFCRRMFMIGLLCDAGYEFSENKAQHSETGAEMLKLLGVTDDAAIRAIKEHSGCPTKPVSDETRILISADLTTDKEGREISVSAKLEDIKERFGEYSDEYLTACDTCYVLGLTAINMAGLTT